MGIVVYDLVVLIEEVVVELLVVEIAVGASVFFHLVCQKRRPFTLLHHIGLQLLKGTVHVRGIIRELIIA